MKVIGIIPARFSSTRFPGKPLTLIKDKPMIQWVYERASQSKFISEILAATDDKRIYDAVTGFGGKAVMTSDKHVSGTDRITEAAENIECEIVVNIQGDEPLINAGDLDSAIDLLIKDPSLNVSTIIKKIEVVSEIENENVVKVVTDKNGNALYFSRRPVPFSKETSEAVYYKHIGIYVYRKNFLMKFADMKVSMLEKAEKLEQLRILENGEKIGTVETQNEYLAVDTPEDVKRVEEIWE